MKYNYDIKVLNEVIEFTFETGLNLSNFGKFKCKF